MIILHVANLHFRRSWFKWLRASAPPHDLLVIAGDLLERSDPASHECQIAWVSEWVRDHPTPICIASGPHDLVRKPGEQLWWPADWLHGLAGPRVWTDGERRDYSGFGVLPLPPGGVARGEAAEVWVVHQGPKGPSVSRSSAGWDGGDPFLLYAIRKYRPRLLLCGHLHAPLSWIESFEDTLYLNPGCDDDAAYPNHLLIDFDGGHIRRVCARAGGMERPSIVPLPKALTLIPPLEMVR